MAEAARKVSLLKPFDVDQINIKQDAYFVNAFLIDLPLNATPDHVWQDVFEQKWKSSRHMWDRKIFVIGSKLRLVTPADDFESKLSWVEKIIEETNKTIDEYLLGLQQDEERRIKAEVQKQTAWEEKARVEMIKDILRRKSS
ncbi:MAG TPA: hypothetical protein VMT26_00250 [Candidatus Bathyarchaeia archaeon]|jgi:hypothetical protein|nr:hypothetical protein [Candidatus Bathyarchaeia archaeon]